MTTACGRSARDAGHRLRGVGQDAVLGAVDDPHRHVERRQLRGDLREPLELQADAGVGQRSPRLGRPERLEHAGERLVGQVRRIGQPEAQRLLEAVRAGQPLAQPGRRRGRDELLDGLGELGVEQGVQERQPGEPVAVAQRPVHPDRPSEVVHGKRDAIDRERVEQPVDRGREEGEVVARAQRLVGGAEARQVDRDDAVALGDRGHDVAPQEGRGGPAVDQQHGRARATELAVADVETVHMDLLHRRGDGHGVAPRVLAQQTDQRSGS